MDPVGITKACTSVVVPNSSRMIVTVHSAMKPRWGVGAARSSPAGRGVFGHDYGAFDLGSTDTHFNAESLLFCL